MSREERKSVIVRKYKINVMLSLKSGTCKYSAHLSVIESVSLNPKRSVFVSLEKKMIHVLLTLSFVSLIRIIFISVLFLFK